MLTTGQRPVGPVAGAFLTLPPGPYQLTLINPGTIAAYVGVVAGTQAVSSTNGFPVPSGGVTPVQVTGYPTGGPGQVLQAVTAGTIPSLAFILSTASGGTGP
jgi:hypothetical protein